MYQGIEGIATGEQPVQLTLYTDAHVIRGTVHTRQRRVTDILNEAEHEFLVLTETIMDEYGTRGIVHRAEYVQVNLASVLFAVASGPVEAVPELRTAKVPEQALISIPPFRIVGRIHLLPERNLRDALEELVGRFVPVTDAFYWSDTVGEARTAAPMIAFNHSRAQILAPHHEVDPWEGLDRAAGDRAPDAIGGVPTSAASTSTPTGTQDPWGTGSPAAGAAPDTGIQDPWGFERGAAPPGEPSLQPSEPSTPTGEPSNPWGGPGGDPWGAGRPRRNDELIG